MNLNFSICKADNRTRIPIVKISLYLYVCFSKSFRHALPQPPICKLWVINCLHVNGRIFIIHIILEPFFLLLVNNPLLYQFSGVAHYLHRHSETNTFKSTMITFTYNVYSKGIILVKFLWYCKFHYKNLFMLNKIVLRIRGVQYIWQN